MKKVNFKVVLVALSFAFIFLMGVNRMDAQTVSTLTAGSTGVPSKGNSVVFSLPQGPFQGSQTALITLKNEMTSIRATLAQLQNESDPTFVALVKLLKYYQRVYDNILSGQSVAQAIVSGLNFLTTDANALSQSDFQTLKNAAINLLN